MTEGQPIHSNYETITDYHQDYRISTRVTFFASSGTYKCYAKLYKSYCGSVSGEPMYSHRNRTREAENVETLVQEGIDECKKRIEDIEQAKCLDIDVTVE